MIEFRIQVMILNIKIISIIIYSTKRGTNIIHCKEKFHNNHTQLMHQECIIMVIMLCKNNLLQILPSPLSKNQQGGQVFLKIYQTHKNKHLWSLWLCIDFFKSTNDRKSIQIIFKRTDVHGFNFGCSQEVKWYFSW